MFHKIEQHPDLYGLQRGSCSENGYCVTLCEALLDNGEPNDAIVKILKVDAFYNTCRMHEPPPSIDCLIIVKEVGIHEYSFYLIELRNVSGSPLIKPRDIRRKFETTLQQFIQSDFSNVFDIQSITLINFKSWLVTDPFNLVNVTQEQYEKKIKGTIYDQYTSIKPLRLKDKVCMIELILPNPMLCFSQ